MNGSGSGGGSVVVGFSGCSHDGVSQREFAQAQTEAANAEADRDAALHARTVTLTVRFADFTTITRSHTLAEPSDLDTVFLKAVRELFQHAWNGKALLRLVGVALTSFSGGSAQFDLLDPERREKLERLARATDKLRDRFGFSKVQFGGSLPMRDDDSE